MTDILHLKQVVILMILTNRRLNQVSMIYIILPKDWQICLKNKKEDLVFQVLIFL